MFSLKWQLTSFIFKRISAKYLVCWVFFKKAGKWGVLHEKWSYFSLQCNHTSAILKTTILLEQVTQVLWYAIPLCHSIIKISNRSSQGSRLKKSLTLLNKFYYIINDILKWSRISFILLEVCGLEKYSDCCYSWLPLPWLVLKLLQFSHHCFCTIDANSNIVKSQLTSLLWKKLWPLNARTGSWGPHRWQLRM